jgi:hypothetical protein
MKRVHVKVPVALDLPGPLVELLEAAAPLVRTCAEHRGAIVALRESGRTFVREANRIVKAERAKKRAGARRYPR